MFVVTSGEDACCSVVFGTLVGLFVFNNNNNIYLISNVYKDTSSVDL